MYYSHTSIYTVSFCCVNFFFFKQKTAYEMRISDWSSDVCSSDLTNFSPASPTRWTALRPRRRLRLTCQPLPPISGLAPPFSRWPPSLQFLMTYSLALTLRSRNFLKIRHACHPAMLRIMCSSGERAGPGQIGRESRRERVDQY